VDCNRYHPVQMDKSMAGSTALQGNLDEMKDHYEISADEDYAAEKYEIGFEDGTDMKDAGSETSEKVVGATDTATGLSDLRKQADEFEKESKERILRAERHAHPGYMSLLSTLLACTHAPGRSKIFACNANLAE
jgi:hypothetical protein